MLPYVTFGGWTYYTSNALMAMVLVLSLITLKVTLGHKAMMLKNAILVGSISFIGLFGARLFHVLLEKPILLNEPEKIVSRADGMVFYGSFLLGVLFFPLIIKFLYPPKLKKQLWDIMTIILAFSYGVLRIGCFASGCCWGKISGLPWSVTYYNDKSAMPYLGIPTHPVQLYDSLGAFVIMALLIKFYRKRKLQGKLFVLFCILYPILRFFTEMFRGDTFRGESVLLGLSTSQTISVGVLVVGGSLFFWERQQTQAQTQRLVSS